MSKKIKTRPTLEQAKAAYVHRFTMEHVPQWASEPFKGQGEGVGMYPAPQYRTDAEWYANTKFEMDDGYLGNCQGDCYTTGETWPLGQRLNQPYIKGQPQLRVREPSYKFDSAGGFWAIDEAWKVAEYAYPTSINVGIAHRSAKDAMRIAIEMLKVFEQYPSVISIGKQRYTQAINAK